MVSKKNKEELKRLADNYVMRGQMYVLTEDMQSCLGDPPEQLESLKARKRAAGEAFNQAKADLYFFINNGI